MLNYLLLNLKWLSYTEYYLFKNFIDSSTKTKLILFIYLSTLNCITYIPNWDSNYSSNLIKMLPDFNIAPFWWFMNYFSSQSSSGLPFLTLLFNETWSRLPWEFCYGHLWCCTLQILLTLLTGSISNEGWKLSADKVPCLNKFC